jgi:hypothetical protein
VADYRPAAAIHHATAGIVASAKPAAIPFNSQNPSDPNGGCKVHMKLKDNVLSAFHSNKDCNGGRFELAGAGARGRGRGRGHAGFPAGRGGHGGFHHINAYGDGTGRGGGRGGSGFSYGYGHGSDGNGVHGYGGGGYTPRSQQQDLRGGGGFARPGQVFSVNHIESTSAQVAFLRRQATELEASLGHVGTPPGYPPVGTPGPPIFHH